jgi:hypothetical protein
MSRAPRVVLDANVLFPFTLRDVLLRTAKTTGSACYEVVSLDGMRIEGTQGTPAPRTSPMRHERHVHTRSKTSALSAGGLSATRFEISKQEVAQQLVALAEHR